MSSTPTRITHDGGLRFIARVREHAVVTDQPEKGGGANTGPSPLELLGVALGSCACLYVRQFCEARDISVEGLGAEVVTHHTRGRPVDTFELTIRFDVLPTDADLEKLRRVVEACPVHQTLAAAADILLTFASVDPLT